MRGLAEESINRIRFNLELGSESQAEANAASLDICDEPFLDEYAQPQGVRQPRRQKR